jgi:peptidoglycan/LPS O-acetylase OafA/YrhL
VAAIRYPTWLPFRLLNLRPVRHLGVLSQSMYLLHQVVIMALATRYESGMLVIAIGSLLLTFALVSLMYRLVEQPFARVRKRLAGARRAGLSSATQGADEGAAISAGSGPSPSRARKNASRSARSCAVNSNGSITLVPK